MSAPTNAPRRVYEIAKVLGWKSPDVMYEMRRLLGDNAPKSFSSSVEPVFAQTFIHTFAPHKSFTP